MEFGKAVKVNDNLVGVGNGKGKIGFGFAWTGKNDFLGIKGEGDFELAAAGDVETESGTEKSAKEGWVVVGLDGVIGLMVGDKTKTGLKFG